MSCNLEWTSTSQFFQRPQIALAIRSRAILLVFEKIDSCLFISNCTRNRVITYTNCTPLSSITTECNLVWNYTRDFKIERAAHSASSIWFQTKLIARHEVQLPVYYTHFEFQNGCNKVNGKVGWGLLKTSESCFWKLWSILQIMLWILNLLTSWEFKV